MFAAQSNLACKWFLLNPHAVVEPIEQHVVETRTLLGHWS
jgi:hypothetical protein